MSKTKIEVRDAAKNPTPEEKEANDIMDRIFAASQNTDLTRDDVPPITNGEQKPLEVIGLMVSREQVNAILSLLAMVDTENSDEEYIELVAPIVAPLLTSGFTPEKFNIVSSEQHKLMPETLALVVKKAGNENVTPE